MGRSAAEAEQIKPLAELDLKPGKRRAPSDKPIVEKACTVVWRCILGRSFAFVTPLNEKARFKSRQNVTGYILVQDTVFHTVSFARTDGPVQIRIACCQKTKDLICGTLLRAPGCLWQRCRVL